MNQLFQKNMDQAFDRIMAMRAAKAPLGDSMNACHMPHGKFYRSEAAFFSEFHILISGEVDGNIESFDSIEQAKSECDGELSFTVQGYREFEKGFNPSHDIAEFKTIEAAQKCCAQLALWSLEGQSVPHNS
ncbi:hypothetical protein C9975_03035 [Thalassospira xiamenensis]|nr:hypothetical protein C9975_03035 [Thalassospira xiamenensis]